FIGPTLAHWDALIEDVLAPFHIPFQADRAFGLARFGIGALQPASWLVRTFDHPQARALLAGCAAHSMLRLEEPLSGAFAMLFLTSAHAVGWPIARGGSSRIAEALAAELADLGGKVLTNRRIEDLPDLPEHGVALFDVTPRQLLSIAGTRMGTRSAEAVRKYRYGHGAFKADIALDGAISWLHHAVAE